MIHAGCADNNHTFSSRAGRQFPVDIFYLKQPTDNYVHAAIDTVINIHKTEPPGTQEDTLLRIPKLPWLTLLVMMLQATSWSF
jgi:hypothetical protein